MHMRCALRASPLVCAFVVKGRQADRTCARACWLEAADAFRCSLVGWRCHLVGLLWVHVWACVSNAGSVPRHAVDETGLRTVGRQGPGAQVLDGWRRWAALGSLGVMAALALPPLYLLPLLIPAFSGLLWVLEDVAFPKEIVRWNRIHFILLGYLIQSLVDLNLP